MHLTLDIPGDLALRQVASILPEGYHQAFTEGTMRGLLSALAILLVACGGNGGGNEDTSTDTQQDTVDTQGDTATDTVPDTFEDTPVDTTVDTPTDTTVDTHMDTATDSLIDPDADSEEDGKSDVDADAMEEADSEDSVVPPHAGPCVPVSGVACDTTISGLDTSVGVDSIGAYACATWDESGHDLAFSFVPVSADDVRVRITGDTGELDLFVLEDSCMPSTCLGHGDEEVVFSAEAGRTYYITVDGYGGAAGTFALIVDCASGCADPACGDHECGDAPGCWGTPCGECPEYEFCDALFQCSLCTCEGRVCGDDGCGNSCGTCATDEECTAEFQCV